MPNLITEEELQLLEAVQSEEDWSKACSKIKERRGGAYPDDWWPKVKLSGMLDRIAARWGGDSKIRVEFYDTHSERDQ